MKNPPNGFCFCLRPPVPPLPLPTPTPEEEEEEGRVVEAAAAAPATTEGEYAAMWLKCCVRVFGENNSLELSHIYKLFG
jgi:hypothetical protein